MSVIPAENQREIVSIARETLPEDVKPDVRPQNRWVVLGLTKEYADREVEPAARDELVDRLRDRGYKVSVVGSDMKVTRPGLDWPTVE